MSEATDRQKKCTNRWHYQPGAILACPVCGMPMSQLKDNPPPSLAVARNPANELSQPRGHRVGIKHFVGVDANEVVREANEWLTKMSGDARTQIAEQLQMFSHNGQLIVAVFYATAL